MASQPDGNTVFMTEQEAERIRNMVKNRSKKCSELTGNAREPKDLTGAKQQATGASLMVDMGAPDADLAQTKGQGGSFPVLPVGQPYPPCIVPLQGLQPIKLTDLKMNTHHRGHYLTIKRISPVVTLLARSWAMVQDEEEETERLEIYLHKLRHGKDVLESTSHFIIKEPHFTLTDQGEATIRIDHPSDLIIRDEASNNQIHDAEVVEKAARKCKDKGNAALEKQNLPLAHAEYTKGLKLAIQDIVTKSNPDLARDLARNRAHVNLLLSQLDEAKSDAKSSLTSREDQQSKELDSKAYFRAGSAAYNLGQYQEAKSLFEQQLKLTPDNKTAIAYLRNIEVRLREQETGEYNFKKIRTGLSRSRPRVDAASFIRNTKVKEIPGRGRGLVATRDIPIGEIVMCEKAFCVVWGHEKEALTAMTYDIRDDRIRVSPVGLNKAIVQKLLNNPSQTEKVMDLFGDYQGEGNNVTRTEDGPVVDTFRVHDIMSRNAFGPGNQYGEEGLSNASTGLWVHAAYINHSCIANAKKEYIGDLMVLRAIRPITPSEEIFHSYDESSDYDARQAALMNTWGFECDCALCTVEKTDDPVLRKKRRDLANDAEEFVGTENWSNAKRLTISKAKRLVRDIENTYDEEKYKGLPRMAAQRIQEWLALANQKSKK
ncbi:SET domain-containing protein [Hypoxylon trugodes]|uniref:SET domain-containing protein n=1 Tax=Hypoxylon trugodes TaxID=326681 RepID=UPI00219D64BF|nr:SET domain-containing protein [Hypoxylon trugodes]KAI1388563.1 SET domain-containing protein [Hypoxylon trugodes]